MSCFSFRLESFDAEVLRATDPNIPTSSRDRQGVRPCHSHQQPVTRLTGTLHFNNQAKRIVVKKRPNLSVALLVKGGILHPLPEDHNNISLPSFTCMDREDFPSHWFKTDEVLPASFSDLVVIPAKRAVDRRTSGLRHPGDIHSGRADIGSGRTSSRMRRERLRGIS